MATSLAGCAHHEIEVEPHATKAEQDAAMLEYKNCMVPYAKRFDDGRSDAKTIAQAMVGTCSTEMNRAAETMSRGENNAVKQGISKAVAANQESFALQIVLASRNSRIN